MKTTTLLILFVISANLFASKDGGGGSEIERLFVEDSVKLLKKLEQLPGLEIDLESIKLSMDALVDIEAVDTLTTFNGNPVPNEKAHYAWVSRGVLQLKTSWWNEKYKNQEVVEADVMHEMLRVTEWYTRDSESFNDDKYRVSVGQLGLTSSNELLVMPETCELKLRVSATNDVSRVFSGWVNGAHAVGGDSSSSVGFLVGFVGNESKERADHAKISDTERVYKNFPCDEDFVVQYAFKNNQGQKSYSAVYLDFELTADGKSYNRTYLSKLGNGRRENGLVMGTVFNNIIKPLSR